MSEIDRVIDLDAARAKRFESYGEPPSIAVHGQSFTLPQEMPWRVVQLWEGELVPFAKVLEGLQVLLGGEWERFLAADVSPGDMADLVTAVYELYSERSRKLRAGETAEEPPAAEEAPPAEAPPASPEEGGDG